MNKLTYEYLVSLVQLELNSLTQSRIYPHNTSIDTHNHCLNSLSKLCSGWIRPCNSIVFLSLQRGPGHGSVFQTGCAAVVVPPSTYTRQLQIPRLDLHDITICVIKLMRSCEYVHILAQCRDQLYGFTVRLYGIFLAAASFASDMASVHDLQKLAESQQCRCCCQCQSTF